MIAYRAGMITQLTERYEQWEARRRRRLARWSVGRRWATFVLVPVMLVCGGGIVLGVPLAWLARTTIDAGRGAKSPDAAADEYLSALGYDQQDGLLPLLDHSRQQELLGQWRKYRAAMDSTEPRPSRLDYASLDVGPTAAGRASVTVQVAAAWWPSGGGMSGGYVSQQLVWRFETRNSGGWRITTVTAPAWCGGYVLATKCSLR
jgi:hypothetical protein